MILHFDFIGGSSMNNSNYSLRMSRSYQEATGKRLHSWDFQPPAPDTGDRIVGIACMVIAIVLPLAAYIFDWKLGG